MPSNTYVIAGAGLAGAKAAETLREAGFDGRVVLIGDEPERPYERPPLSKDYLRGETSGRPYVHPPAFYAEQGIQLRTDTTVEAIDPGASQVHLADGETLRFERLLLATGAEPRRLRIPGAELDGVEYLRTVADADTLRAQLRPDARVAIVGAGWIGAEVAASARQLGCDVTLLEAGQLPLERVLGAELGAIYRDLHVERGVHYLGAVAVEAFEGDGDGAVAAVRLDTGRRIEADVVVVGVGVTPRVGLAQAAGLDVDNGVLVDEHLRTSNPTIYAAGDMANAWHPFFQTRIRVEHWANAIEQGRTAARNMLGHALPYEHLPYFFSDQYDVGMEYAGHATSWHEIVIRGDRERRELIAFWVRGGRVLAGMNMNIWDATNDIQALIRSRAPIDHTRLADPNVPLAELLPASSVVCPSSGDGHNQPGTGSAAPR